MEKHKATAELINIIKELYYNSTGVGISSRVEGSNNLIARVDSQFNECDERIDKYIRNSNKDLTRLIKVFNEISKKIETSRASVKQSREALKQCKVLLQSKRDDVRRLWLEWCEQKFYYENLSKLKRLYSSSEQIRLFTHEKNFIKAAELLSDSSQILSSEFRDINGLSEIKRQLDEERIKLEKCLFNELSEQLYSNVTKSVLESDAGLPQQSASAGNTSRRFYRNYASSTSNISKTASSSSSSSSSSELIIQCVVQSAAKLANAQESNSSIASINILDKMIQEINKDMNNRLISMINTTSNHVVESNLIGNISNRKYFTTIENNPKYLSQLIELAFEQLRIVAHLYKNFIDYAAKFNNQSPSKHQHGLIWTCVQNILIQLLEEYLDTRQLNAQLNPNADLLDRMDINSFFARKRLLNLGFGSANNEANQAANSAPNQNAINTNNNVNNVQSLSANNYANSNGFSFFGGEEISQRRLFTFKGSSHAMSINSYIREKNNEDLFVTNDFSNDDNSNVNNLSVNSLASEQRVFKILVCQPDTRNITTIFSTMEHIIKDICDEIRSIPVEQRPDLILDKFVQEFILTKFITNAVESIKENAKIHSTHILHSSTSNLIDAENSNANIYDMSNQLISLQKQKELALSKPILESSFLVYQSCTDLFDLIRDMSSYASQFTLAMHSLIDKHTTHANQLFLSIVCNNSSESDAASYVYSMIWVQDEGIKTYFKQLPAFSSAIKNRPTPAAQLAAMEHSNTNPKNSQNFLVLSGLSTGASDSSGGTDAGKITTATVSLNSQSPAVFAAQVELEQTNIELLSKEVETLIGNLNDVNRDLEEGDIITNYNFIEMIAHLNESADWLIVQLKYILNALEQMIKNPKTLNNSLSLNELNRLQKQLDDFDKWRGDTLLLLYLEIRVHCFYHLINFIRQDNTLGTLYSGDVDTDPDECVLNMNRDLHRIYEQLSRSLQESKLNYIFDGLGFMIATIFVRAIRNFKKISAHGIAKMCRNIFNVEQNLSAMRTKSDPHLMRVHRFYELLYKKPEELINHLQEHEAEFHLEDYKNLLNLIYRSQPGYEINTLSENIQSLANIFKNKNKNN